MTLASPLTVLANPQPDDIATSPEAFLEQLKGPTLITLAGQDSSRTRALSTLLHGNEPSGLRALHRWLKSGEQPAVNLVCLLASVQAAQMPPLFTHRQRPGFRDQNRCFRPPFSDQEGQIAEAFLQVLEQQSPEALLDIHNTSGSGPAFGVSIRNDAAHRNLTSLFTQRLILTDLRLGALMEYSEKNVPTVTIECGGAQDEDAHLTAWDGICRYFRDDDILSTQPADWEVEILANPVRIEIESSAQVCYGLAPNSEADITLLPGIEHFNFGVLSRDQSLGWITGEGLDGFRVKNQQGEDIRKRVLRQKDGQLYPAQDLRAFMITTNPLIAKSDCLFYAIPHRGEGF